MNFSKTTSYALTVLSFLAEIIDSVEGLNVLGTCIMGFKKEVTKRRRISGIIQ